MLGVIKEKYGLKDKAEALNKFAEMFGEEFVERDVDEKLLKEMIKECEAWETKSKFGRKMTLEELDRLCSYV